MDGPIKQTNKQTDYSNTQPENNDLMRLWKCLSGDQRYRKQFDIGTQ